MSQQLTSNDLRHYLLSDSQALTTITTTTKSSLMGSHQSKAYLSSGQVINVENFVLHIPTFVSGLLSLAAFSIVLLVLYCTCRKFLRSKPARRIAGHNDAPGTTPANGNLHPPWHVAYSVGTPAVAGTAPIMVAPWQTLDAPSAENKTSITKQNPTLAIVGAATPPPDASAPPSHLPPVYPKWG